ncbi:hypothetical protein LTR56_010845 [Elasticomyces elasticus]|nr:hypothetical protein LTR56_010845 [Elasticomyces elasticus]KAK3650282.1 hypothetical protein LTR22_012609 [Elasticomyces elasticus]KAK4932293.1 hypothetical protein LTR49_001162 [Elasticomyces elasticus]KAK5768301.1 hypothetical protein LTS12_001440 [Elasticomyces elasticus]
MCEHDSGKKENKYSKSNQRAETALASLDIGAATSVDSGPPLLEKSHDYGRQGQALPINYRGSPQPGTQAESGNGFYYKSIVSIHDGKGMNDIDSDEEQVPKESRSCSNRRPKNQKLNRKEKTGIELVEIDVRRQQLRSEYDAETDHMCSHDIDLTTPALATTNVVVLRSLSPLPADHDLSRNRFEEKSVKDGVYDTIDDGLSNVEKLFLARAYLWTKKLERGLQRRHDEAPVPWIQVSAGILGLLSRLQEWARSRSVLRLAIIAEVTEVEYVPDGQSGTVGFWLFTHAELCTHEVSEKLGAEFGVIKHDQKRKTGKAKWAQRTGKKRE